MAFDNSAWSERGPIDFDVSITVQKQTPQKTLYQNELALQLMNQGLITKEDALEMMTFQGKDRVLARAGNLQTAGKEIGNETENGRQEGA
jgi:hypothetical protein